MDEVVVYSQGVIAMSVCTVLDDEETVEWVNQHHPTGISSRWGVDEDETFNDGTLNPALCETMPGRGHLLLNC